MPMKLLKTASLILLALLFGCKPDAPAEPYRYETNPAYTWGFADFYGNYYAPDIENNAVTLHLLTQNLTVGAENQLEGTGQYLILEDIFIDKNDTILPAGTYRVAETGEPFTFYSGRKFEDSRATIPSGAYVYFIEPAAANSKIAYITGGQFTLSVEQTPNDTTFTIQCDFMLDEKTELKGTYNGALRHFDQMATPPPPAGISAARRRF